jgi:hypothetical protein
LSGIADQSKKYGKNLPGFVQTTELLPFLCKSAGEATFFRSRPRRIETHQMFGDQFDILLLELNQILAA